MNSDPLRNKPPDSVDQDRARIVAKIKAKYEEKAIVVEKEFKPKKYTKKELREISDLFIKD